MKFAKILNWKVVKHFPVPEFSVFWRELAANVFRCLTTGQICCGKRAGQICPGRYLPAVMLWRVPRHHQVERRTEEIQQWCNRLSDNHLNVSPLLWGLMFTLSISHFNEEMYTRLKPTQLIKTSLHVDGHVPLLFACFEVLMLWDDAACAAVLLCLCCSFNVFKEQDIKKSLVKVTTGVINMHQLHVLHSAVYPCATLLGKKTLRLRSKLGPLIVSKRFNWWWIY